MDPNDAALGLASCTGEGYIVKKVNSDSKMFLTSSWSQEPGAAFRSLETSSVNIGERFESCPLRSTHCCHNYNVLPGEFGCSVSDRSKHVVALYKPKLKEMNLLFESTQDSLQWPRGMMQRWKQRT